MEKREKLQRTFEKFEKAFNKFKEITASPSLFDFLSEELIVEVATKRFEYTFESIWKVLKEFFRKEGVECSTPLSCFKEAFKAGIISDRNEEIFLTMIEKRNQIVHIYDVDEAKSIYEFIKDKNVFSAFEDIYEKIKEFLQGSKN